jgi:hypothetical protein
MPVNQNAQKQNMEKNATVSALRKLVRKAPGTRVGTLVDWRRASHTISGRHGHVLRDGR